VSTTGLAEPRITESLLVTAFLVLRQGLQKGLAHVLPRHRPDRGEIRIA
jgi:hypothetical protein